MASAGKKKKAGKKRGSTTFEFSLSWTGLFSYLFLGCLALIWVFILGVIVGRGYNPESLLPGVARFIPGYSVDNTEDKAGENGHRVLEPKDLDFFEDLKKKVKVQFEQQEEPGRKEALSREESGGSPAAEQKPQYHCVYQVASFKTKEQAAKVVSGLKKNDLAASIHRFQQPDQSWFRVYVSLTGDTEDIHDLEQKLKRLGLGHYFLRTKSLQ